MTDELNVVQSAQRCRQLLSKGLYINHGLPPGEEAAGDGNFWCGRTQGVYGPDDQLCDADFCTNPTRGCYDAP